MAKPPKTRPQTIELPNVSEVFADSLTYVYFDEGNFRIELAVTRLVTTPPKEPVRQRFTACRLVMSATAVMQLSKRLNHVLGVLEQQGIFKRQHVPSSQVQ